MTEGKDVDDADTLIALAETVGMSKELVEGVLNSDAYGQEVKTILAQQIGVQGVPFFVF
jgi:predicted DsbA family dithiol-disulfide isomerase